MKKIEAYGEVLQGEPDHTFRLKHPRMAWDRARIEIHQHRDKTWMWSTSWQCESEGGGYRVGVKWGKFAETREDALFYAAREIEQRLAGKWSADAALILKWTATIKENPEAFR
ncbi:hypothetical protein [Rhizobium halophilum]|uniref:hypothetical protein n=1 Tax=Rhizobium halophilum TaxID=2846852 RepID=UPI001EFDA095|nr:hypothetical protein [Rhizobium halophilum]MCF6371081.1 hypothetical protein [Rhizobium halophilum]